MSRPFRELYRAPQKTIAQVCAKRLKCDEIK
jgi:hypothetical protein